jgi:hypothetical protein
LTSGIHLFFFSPQLFDFVQIVPTQSLNICLIFSHPIDEFPGSVVGLAKRPFELSLPGSLLELKSSHFASQSINLKLVFLDQILAFTLIIGNQRMELLNFSRHRIPFSAFLLAHFQPFLESLVFVAKHCTSLLVLVFELDQLLMVVCQSVERILQSLTISLHFAQTHLALFISIEQLFVVLFETQVFYYEFVTSLEFILRRKKHICKNDQDEELIIKIFFHFFLINFSLLN